MNMVVRSNLLQSLAAPVTIGRDPTNTVVVDDPLASRHHAILRRTPDGRWTLSDRSANGTFVNGRAVHRSAVIMNEHDELSIGMCTYHFVGGRLLDASTLRPVVLTACNVSVTDASGRPLVGGVDLSLRKGHTLAVVGCSGAGKSTLLRTLAGIQRPDHGSIAVGDGCRVGFVPQDDVMHTSLTVRAALLYGARLRFPRTVTNVEINARVDEVIDELGLTTRATHRIDTLSGGERKRVNVGLELLTQPSLLFVDEPTSGLDPASEAAVMGQLHQLAAHGCAVVVVTHATHCLDGFDEVLVLTRQGRVAYLGPPDGRRATFGTASWPSIFASLDKVGDFAVAERSPAQRPRCRSIVHFRPGVTQCAHRGSFAKSTVAGRDQYTTLLRRFVSVLTSDRKHLVLLIGQAPIISVLIMVLSRGALANSRPETGSHASIALLSIVLGVAYLGASNAVREIVKEKAIVQREKLFGLSSWAYIGSKATVLSLLIAVQSACLVLVGLALDGRHTSAVVPLWPATFELVITTFFTGCAAMCVGLLISAIATNVDKATAALPVVLLAMYLLSGGPSDLSRTPIMREISHVNVAKWGLAGVAATTDLNRLNRCNESVREAPVAGAFASAFGGQCRGQWAHRLDSVMNAWVALLLIALGALLIAGRVTNRYGRGPTKARTPSEFH
jgi:ABC transport system ATP-binding/permease protein